MAFTATTAVELVAIGFGVGAFGTLIGAGGGFILTPILLLLYPHDSPQTITAISLAVVFFNALSGSTAYARQRRIDYRSGVVFAVATLPGAVGGALYSLVVGFVSSFLGIGGGVIHVPLLVRALGFPTHIATATSHFVLAVMSGVGALTHVAAGSFAHGRDVLRAAWISAGIVVGAQIGAHLSQRLHGKLIERLLAAALLVLAARLIIAA